jgi:ABC-type enterochelin transport system permease subunit
MGGEKYMDNHKKILKISYSAVIYSFAAVQVFLLAKPAWAVNLGMNYAENLGLAKADPRVAVISLISLLMTFLGIIAIVIILYGGFVWMTAAGAEDRVSKAKKIITSGIIGLIVILSSWLIINFVEENVSNALNG